MNRSVILISAFREIRKLAIFQLFPALLKLAYQEKMLRENLNDFIDKIEWKEVKKQYLTLAEVKKLAATPCKIPVLKQASLFSCMTGLRISGILNLHGIISKLVPTMAITSEFAQKRQRRKLLSPSVTKNWNYVVFLVQAAYLKD